MNFVFTLRNSGPAKTGPAGPIPMPLCHYFVSKLQNHPKQHVKHIIASDSLQNVIRLPEHRIVFLNYLKICEDRNNTSIMVQNYTTGF